MQSRKPGEGIREAGWGRCLLGFIRATLGLVGYGLESSGECVLVSQFTDLSFRTHKVLEQCSQVECGVPRASWEERRQYDL